MSSFLSIGFKVLKTFSFLCKLSFNTI